MSNFENFEGSSISMSESLPIKPQAPLSHNLDDATFDIEIEKKFLESYALRQEDAKKLIKVKNYSIADVETSRNLFGKIQNEVITQSESTNEAKATNWESDLKYVKEAKEQANKFINKPDMAIVEYLKILKEIDEIFAPIKDYHLFEFDSNLRAIVEQKKLVMSNLALAYSKKGYHRDAIDLDLKIVAMDEKFDKSYARLVASYLQIDNIHEAHVYANKLRSSFNAETVAKYENILSRFDEAQKKSENSMRNFMKKSKKNEENAIKKEEVKKVENIQTHVARNSRKFSFFGAFLGGLILISSSAGLFFLYKFRKNFLGK